jgi:hypothetical protein
MTTPCILLTGSTEAQTFLKVTEKVMHNAEKVVDERWLAGDVLIREREEWAGVVVVQWRRGAVCAVRRRYIEVVVLRNILLFYED